MLLINQTEPIPAETEVKGQLAGCLPVILEVSSKVVLGVVGFRDVGRENAVGASDIVHPTWNGRCRWCQQKLRHARGAGVVRGNISVLTVEVELPSRPTGLQSCEVDMLVFHPHLETVLPIDIGEIIRKLQGLADFV